MHILVLNGPNLNMLGIREPEHYGTQTLADLTAMIEAEAARLGITVECRQSNHEGELVDWIQGAYGKADGILINPAAYTHTSVALLDAVKAVSLPTVEVHISDPDTRDEFRKISYIRQACIATVKGKGFPGYIEGMQILVRHIAAKRR
ncbi:MAG: type II 3-dehydroquinate dehydratase [Oscillospiraceae bacterium]|nr:type II 3-dehydroquinate dehydratase [Oscillospiraceae bacterium]MBR6107179.1 type II 3-dehydroquinate dehydratase [Oscillospiraceae bacterium]